MGVRDVVIKVTADTSQAVRGFQRMNRSVGGQLTKQEKAMAGLRRAAIPATAALVGLGVGAKKAVDAAADMNEALSKNEVLFTTQANDVAEWSKSMASGFGISRQAALDAAGVFATFGKAAGLKGSDLSGFSTGLTELASDLASFNNTSPEEAIEALGSALRGEAEPMRKYGVLLDDASLRQEALAQGLIKTTKQALTPQQKVLAAQALIYKQTADAQGDFARTSDSAANRQKALRAQLENITAELGNALLPAFTMLVGWLQKAARWASKNTTTVKVLIVAFGGIAAAIVAANVAMKAYKIVTDAARFAQIALNAAMRMNPIGIVVTALAALAAGIYIAYEKSETFRAIVQKVWEWLSQLGGWLVGVGSTLFDGLKSAFELVKPPMDAVVEVLQWLWNTGRNAVNFFTKAFQFTPLALAFKAIKEAIGPVVDGLKWLWNTGRNAVNFFKGVFSFNNLKNAFSAVWKVVEPLINGLKWLWNNFSNLMSKLRSLIGLGGSVPKGWKNPLAPGGSLNPRSLNAPTEINVTVDAPAVQHITEEQVARAIARIMQKSDARNGLAWSL